MLEVMREQQRKQCLRLKSGESANVEFAGFVSPTGIDAHYRLSRPEADLYVAELRLSFYRDKDYDGKAKTDAELNQLQREKLADCFRYVSKSLLGPSGERLELKLSEDPQVPGESIPVGGSGHRADAHKYSSRIDCPTMIHETLHLLGLVDEYKENKLGYVRDRDSGEKRLVADGSGRNAFDCRTYGPPDSVMFSQWRVTDAMDFDEYEAVSCSCEDKSKECEGKEKTAEGASCPAGTTQGVALVMVPRGEAVRDGRSEGHDFLLRNGHHRKIREVPRSVPTILKPGQFRAITQPGCQDVNSKYYSCAPNAYRFSESSGMLMGGGCVPAPPFCQSGDMDWLD